MKSLKQISKKYNTDKKNHGFIEHYDDLLNEFQNQKINFLEIGVFYGESIKMWSEFFNDGLVFGLDTFEGLQGNGIRFDNADSFYKEWSSYKDTNIRLMKCDQSSETDLQKFKEYCIGNNISFKIILDDGSHLMKDQQVTFSILFDLLEEGGYYIIEDSHSSDDLSGYDVEPDFSNTTKKVFLEFQKNKKIDSKYIAEKESNRLSENIDYVYNFISQNNESQSMIIKKIK